METGCYVCTFSCLLLKNKTLFMMILLCACDFTLQAGTDEVNDFVLCMGIVFESWWVFIFFAKLTACINKL